MAEGLFWTHSGLRYLVLLAGLVTALLAALAPGRPASGALRVAWKAFLVVANLQLVVGLAVVFTRPFQSLYIGHIVMMAAAVAALHAVGAAFRRRPAERQTGVPLLGGAVTALALIVGGILALGRSVV